MSPWRLTSCAQEQLVSSSRILGAKVLTVNPKVLDQGMVLSHILEGLVASPGDLNNIVKPGMFGAACPWLSVPDGYCSFPFFVSVSLSI